MGDKQLEQDGSQPSVRFAYLRAQLVVSRALDGALWRYFYLRELAKEGRFDDEVLAEIDADFETVKAHAKELCPGLKSPIPQIRDTWQKAHSLRD